MNSDAIQPGQTDSQDAFTIFTPSEIHHNNHSQTEKLDIEIKNPKLLGILLSSESEIIEIAGKTGESIYLLEEKLLTIDPDFVNSMTSLDTALEVGRERHAIKKEVESSKSKLLALQEIIFHIDITKTYPKKLAELLKYVEENGDVPMKVYDHHNQQFLASKLFLDTNASDLINLIGLEISPDSDEIKETVISMFSGTDKLNPITIEEIVSRIYGSENVNRVNRQRVYELLEKLEREGLLQIAKSDKFNFYLKPEDNNVEPELTDEEKVKQLLQTHSSKANPLTNIQITEMLYGSTEDMYFKRVYKSLQKLMATSLVERKVQPKVEGEKRKHSRPPYTYFLKTFGEPETPVVENAKNKIEKVKKEVMKQELLPKNIEIIEETEENEDLARVIRSKLYPRVADALDVTMPFDGKTLEDIGCEVYGTEKLTPSQYQNINNILKVLLNAGEIERSFGTRTKKRGPAPFHYFKPNGNQLTRHTPTKRSNNNHENEQEKKLPDFTEKDFGESVIADLNWLDLALIDAYIDHYRIYLIKNKINLDINRSDEVEIIFDEKLAEYCELVSNKNPKLKDEIINTYREKALAKIYSLYTSQEIPDFANTVKIGNLGKKYIQGLINIVLEMIEKNVSTNDLKNAMSVNAGTVEIALQKELIDTGSELMNEVIPESE